MCFWKKDLNIYIKKNRFSPLLRFLCTYITKEIFNVLIRCFYHELLLYIYYFQAYRFYSFWIPYKRMNFKFSSKITVRKESSCKSAVEPIADILKPLISDRIIVLLSYVKRSIFTRLRQQKSCFWGVFQPEYEKHDKKAIFKYVSNTAAKHVKLCNVQSYT